MEKIKGLDDADNFEDLYDVLRKTGTLIGSGHVFDADTLIGIIEGFREGKRDRLAITRSGGLRDKVISLQKAEKNKVENIKGLDKVKNFDDLYVVLRQAGTVVGSNGVFSSDTLIQLIDDVRAGKREDDVITRSGGLREKVNSLLDDEFRKMNNAQVFKDLRELAQMPQIGEDITLVKTASMYSPDGRQSPVKEGESVSGKLAEAIEVGKSIRFDSGMGTSPVTNVRIHGPYIIITTTRSRYEIRPKK